MHSLLHLCLSTCCFLSRLSFHHVCLHFSFSLDCLSLCREEWFSFLEVTVNLHCFKRISISFAERIEPRVSVCHERYYFLIFQVTHFEFFISLVLQEALECFFNVVNFVYFSLLAFNHASVPFCQELASCNTNFACPLTAHFFTDNRVSLDSELCDLWILVEEINTLPVVNCILIEGKHEELGEARLVVD